MHVYLKDHFLYLAVSFVCGFALSIVYDLFRIFRLVRGNVYNSSFTQSRCYSALSMFAFYEKNKKQIKNERVEWIIYFFEDLIYSLIVCIVVVISAYCFNYGMVRFFSVLSMVLGYVLWRIIFGRFFIMTFEHIVYILRVALFYFFYPMTFLCKKIKKVIYKSIILLYNKKREKEATAKSANIRNNRTKISLASVRMERK